MASLMNLTVGMIGLSYTELMLIWNSDVDGAGICVRIVLLIVYLSNCFFWFIWGGLCRINNSSKCSNYYGPRAFGGPADFVWNLLFKNVWKGGY